MKSLIDPTPRKIVTGLEVGPLGFGTWRLVAMPVADAQARIEAALSCGMMLIDTADVYGLDWGGDGFGASESLLGEVLAASPDLRSRMVLATKGGIIPGIPYDSGQLATACENSLKRLRVEQIDLYQIHRPDMLTHPEEVARTLEDLRTAGKIREVGVSNHIPSQTSALMQFLPFPLATQQPEYSALHLDPFFNGTFDQCMQHGQTVLNWSPLGGGRLASGEGLSNELCSALDDLAAREHVDRATLALAFSLAHPVRPVSLIGTTKIERIGSASRALEVQLDRADVYRIIQASMGEALP